MRISILGLCVLSLLYACKNEGDSTNAAAATTDPQAPVLSGSSSPVVPAAVPDSSFLYLDAAGFESIIGKKKNVAIIDLRSTADYKRGHIHRAASVPYSGDAAFWSFFDKIGSSQPLAIYCQNGYTGDKVGMALREKGFKKIYVLKGGVDGWLFSEKMLVTF